MSPWKVIFLLAVGFIAGTGWGYRAHGQTVLDGDSIKLDGVTLRLWAIDAPEMRQTCDGWAAGAASAAFLRSILSQRRVKCDGRGKDKYGRTIARCWADEFDVQAEMVRAGMAWAYVKYSLDYLPQEQKARADKLGIHDHNCIPAWEWRAKHDPD